MMSNLFSIFDPSTKFIFNWNWLSIILFLILLPNNFWFISSIFFNFIYLYIKMILNEFKSLLDSNKLNLLMFISLMLMILLMNFLSLFPYIFNPTSHMMINLSMSIPLWFSMMIYGWMKFTNHMFTHTLPMNTPYLLIPFMICIETLSNIIRPITLSIRLTANMIAGHILLSLIGQSFINLPILLMSIMIIPELMLMILEICVSLIQSYVFSILLLMYSKEIN
uniref:ATP synthase subunit a n=1 Tax=Eustenogaster scitula TaxID=1980568 RepID=A0A509ZV65_9HYME|nr:ATP synthase F0 subunit 6 [Eustenogaster scitula]ARO89842.1 ATP synthase F0 subunit 6 [Eustenogaster scitula]